VLAEGLPRKCEALSSKPSAEQKKKKKEKEKKNITIYGKSPVSGRCRRLWEGQPWGSQGGECLCLNTVQPPTQFRIIYG
jgi:hypothetical protein